MARDVTIHFVCIRGSHHRRGTSASRLCDYLGCPAYCPAGDIGDHDWVVTSTDIATLARLGYIVDDRSAAGELEQDERRVLSIREVASKLPARHEVEAR